MLRPPRPRHPITLSASRRLRRDMTHAERVLWRVLRQETLGIRFRRQHPIGNAIADFAAVEARLVVEVDGGQHGAARDAVRDTMLRDAGWLVLRYWNNEVIGNPEGVAQSIARIAAERVGARFPPP